MDTQYLPQITNPWMSLDEPDAEPIMAPDERVAEFETEVDAINYCVDQAVRNRRGLTQMQLADDMRITRAVLTKLRQGQAAVPVDKFVTFIRKTGNYALLQYYARRFDMALVKRDRLEQLERENAEYRRLYTGVVGREE